MQVTRKKFQNEIDKITRNLELMKNTMFSNTSYTTGLDWLYDLKFNKTYIDPLLGGQQNFIEIINQTFTYYTSLLAAKDIFNSYNWVQSIDMNLGSKKGVDIESDVSSNGEIILAEVFSVVDPGNNSKLSKELNNILLRIPTKGNVIKEYRHIYFHSPDSKGYYHKKFKHTNVNGVVVTWIDKP